jgi:hypothetical protein
MTSAWAGESAMGSDEDDSAIQVTQTTFVHSLSTVKHARNYR